jgi:PST family polysaccharide transporter
MVELGFRQALIQQAHIDATLLASTWWLNLAVSLLFVFTLALGANTLEALAQTPNFSAIMLALLPLLPLAAMRVVPTALLERRLQFRTLAAVEIVSTLAGCAAAITLAQRGAGAWSLVAQMLVASAALTFLLVPLQWRPALRFSWQPVKSLLRPGGQIASAESVDFVGRYADDFIIGRFLGAHSLGHYTLAYQVMLFPLLTVSRLIGRVLLPAASRMQHNNAGLGFALTEVFGVVTRLTLPLMLGVAAAAEPLVLLTLGENWRPIVPVLQILAPVGALQSVMVLSESLFIAMGRADLRLRWSLILTLCAIAGVVCGLPFGLVGAAAGYALANALLAPFLLLSICRLVDLKPATLARDLMRPLLSCVVMLGVVVVMADSMTGQSGSLLWQAALPVLAGVASYAALIIYLDGRRLRRLLGEVLKAEDVT